MDEEGNKTKNYYTSESVGIATGFLINALHRAGLATLTHTPNPMRFLSYRKRINPPGASSSSIGTGTASR